MLHFVIHKANKFMSIVKKVSKNVLSFLCIFFNSFLIPLTGTVEGFNFIILSNVKDGNYTDCYSFFISILFTLIRN